MLNSFSQSLATVINFYIRCKIFILEVLKNMIFNMKYYNTNISGMKNVNCTLEWIPHRVDQERHDLFEDWEDEVRVEKPLLAKLRHGTDGATNRRFLCVTQALDRTRERKKRRWRERKKEDQQGNNVSPEELPAAGEPLRCPSSLDRSWLPHRQWPQKMPCVVPNLTKKKII